MQKLILILISCLISLAAQINLKVTSPMIPTSFSMAVDMGIVRVLALLLRVGFVSGLSLLMTWVCYRRFGFLELAVAQSVMFLFVIAASRWVFHEPITTNRIGAVCLILAGIALYYMPTSAKPGPEPIGSSAPNATQKIGPSVNDGPKN